MLAEKPLPDNYDCDLWRAILISLMSGESPAMVSEGPDPVESYQ